MIGLILLAGCFAALGLYISSLIPPDRCSTGLPGRAAVPVGNGYRGNRVGKRRASLFPVQTFRKFQYRPDRLVQPRLFLLFTITFLVLTIRHLEGERLNG